MIVYKYFLKITLKYKLIILGYVLIFMFLALMSSGASKNIEQEFMETKLNIGLVDNANSELSKRFTKYLTEKNNIVEMEGDREFIKEQIFLQIVDGVVVIPKDFDHRVLNEKEAISLYKDDRKIETSYLEQQIEKYFIFLNGLLGTGINNLDILEQALKEKSNINMVDISNKSNNVNSWFVQYYNFASYIIIAVYIAIIGMVMGEFRIKSIENRIKISSKKLHEYNKEIYLGQMSLGLIITCFFIFVSIILKYKFIEDIHLSKYIINILVFSFSILCFTFLINNITGNKLIINGISTVISLGISFISGVMVSQELLSDKALKMARLFPSYYFVKVNERNINSIVEIRNAILIQITFGVLFLILGLIISKIRQKN